MKKTIIFASILLLPATYVPNAVASTCPYGGSPNWQGVCDTTTDSGQSYFGPPSDTFVEDEPDPDPEPTPEPTSSPTSNVPNDQDEPEMWAIVDESGNTQNIIVCDADYCGSGKIPVNFDGSTPTEWANVVLQSSRDPETGNYNGGHWGQYNSSNNTWTYVSPDGSVYKIPTEYGSSPICIENCPVPEEDIVVVSQSSGNEEERISQNISSQPRSFSVVAQTTDKTFSFSKKFPIRSSIKGGKIWVVATNGSKKSVWKFRVANKNKTNITLPIKYSNWNISINYVLKNNNKVSNKIFLI